MAELETLESYLEHNGVKGMKWGVRKGSSGGKSQSFAQKRRAKKRAKKEADGYYKMDAAGKKNYNNQKAQEHNEKLEKRARTGQAIILGGTLAYLVGPAVLDISMRTLGSVALHTQAERNRKRTAPVVQALGHFPVQKIKLKEKNGVWG